MLYHFRGGPSTDQPGCHRRLGHHRRGRRSAPGDGSLGRGVGQDSTDPGEKAPLRPTEQDPAPAKGRQEERPVIAEKGRFIF